MSVPSNHALAYENRLVINVVDAMLGAVTPNLRAVLLSLKQERAALIFLLEAESETDRNEIEDVTFEFQAKEPDLILDVFVEVDDGPFDDLTARGRLVFRRREE